MNRAKETMLTQYDEGIMTGTSRASRFVDDVVADEIPVFRPLAATMNVDLVMNPDSKVWILHDKPFPDILMWVEYDIDAATLTLVYRNGKIQDLGIKIHAPMRKYLRSARQLFTMRLEGEQIVDTYIRPLLVRETGYYKA
jgi:hypothetical protein